MNTPLYQNDNNKAMVEGIVLQPFTFHHEAFGEKFYVTLIEIMRPLDGIHTVQLSDQLFILVSERLINLQKDPVGLRMRVRGQIRTFTERKETDVMHIRNKENINKNTQEWLQLGKIRYVLFATEITESNHLMHVYENNQVVLHGFICKQPSIRQIASGNEVASFMVAVNRAYGKSDYIPCIVFGRNASYAASIEIGQRVTVTGRLQSRLFFKRNPNESQDVICMTWELYVSQIEVFEESNNSARKILCLLSFPYPQRIHIHN